MEILVIIATLVLWYNPGQVSMAFRVSSSGIKLSGRDGDQTLNGSNVMTLPSLMIMLTESDPDCSEPLKNAAEQSEKA